MSWTDDLHSWITSCESKGVIAILTHRNGDMDTIASGCALAEALGSNTRCVGIHVSKVAREVIQKLNFHHHRMDSDRPAWPRHIASVKCAGQPRHHGSWQSAANQRFFRD